MLRRSSVFQLTPGEVNGVAAGGGGGENTTAPAGGGGDATTGGGAKVTCLAPGRAAKAVELKGRGR